MCLQYFQRGGAGVPRVSCLGMFLSVDIRHIALNNRPMFVLSLAHNTLVNLHGTISSDLDVLPQVIYVSLQTIFELELSVYKVTVFLPILDVFFFLYSTPSFKI